MAGGVLLPGAAHAASLYFSAPEFSQSLYAPFEVEVRLDSPDEAINAIDGTVEFGPGTVELVDVADGSSIINLWIDKPAPFHRAVELAYNSSTAVHFAGIVPGGFQGRSGKLFSLVFAPQSAGEIYLRFGSSTLAYLNGPDGQRATLQLSPSSLVVRSEKLPASGVARADSVPPEPFTPQLIHSQNLYGNQWALAFVAADKLSGISHYEVWERPAGLLRYFFASPQWATATSPYLLQDQDLRHILYVKAVDRAGNEQVAMLRPSGVRSRALVAAVAGGVVILLLLVGGYTATRRYARRR